MNKRISLHSPYIPVLGPLSIVFQTQHYIALRECLHTPHLGLSCTASHWQHHTSPLCWWCTSSPSRAHICSHTLLNTPDRTQLSIAPHERFLGQFLEHWHTSTQEHCSIAHLEQCYTASLCLERSYNPSCTGSCNAYGRQILGQVFEWFDTCVPGHQHRQYLEHHGIASWRHFRR